MKYTSVILLLMWSMLACAEGDISTVKTDFVSNSSPSLSWQKIRFKLVWSAKAGVDGLIDKPKWHLDALLAKELALPSLLATNSSIGYAPKLWRFHRRAADDLAGHQFSLLTYATHSYNISLCNAIMANKMVEDLKATNLLESVKCDIPQNSDINENVEGSSDPSWDPIIQKAWPKYIQGVSETWLDIIEQVKTEQSVPPNLGVVELADRYVFINNKITDLWQADGNHAFMHHISGIFGYKGVLMRF